MNIIRYVRTCRTNCMTLIINLQASTYLLAWLTVFSFFDKAVSTFLPLLDDPRSNSLFFLSLHELNQHI